MNPLRLLLVSVVATGTAAAQTPAAPFVPGANTLFSADFSAAGALPPNVRIAQGTPAWGQQGGLSMLKASGPTEFIITLPDVLPQHFTIEADLFTSSTAAEIEFAVQGTLGMTGTTRSALVAWNHQYAAVFRGGAAAGDQYFYPSPDVLPELRNQVVHIQIVMDGTHLTYFTNDEMLADIPDLVFKRDKILLVYLGGTELPNGEVYLALLRIGSNTGAQGVVATSQQGLIGAGIAGQAIGGAIQPVNNAPAPGTVVTGPSVTPPASAGAINVGPRPAAGPPPVTTQSGSTGTLLPSSITGVSVSPGTTGPIVTWFPLTASVTYTVQRWKIDDLTCCNNSSPTNPPLIAPPWQDAALPVAGTYVYEVTATSTALAASTSGRAQYVNFRTPGTIATPAPGPSQTLGPRSGAPMAAPVLVATLCSPQQLLPGRGPGVITIGWSRPAGADVSWNEVPGALAYVVERGLTGSATPTRIGSTCETPPAVETVTMASGGKVLLFRDVSGGTAQYARYTYVVRAFGAAGESGWNSVRWTSPALPRIVPWPPVVTGSTVTLRWDQKKLDPLTSLPVAAPQDFLITSSYGLSQIVPMGTACWCSANILGVPIGSHTFTITARYPPDVTTSSSTQATVVAP